MWLSISSEPGALKDYVYLPLGGRSGNRLTYARNILLTFTFSGLWHGANWTYVLWGFTNGLYFLPLIALGGPRQQPPLAAARRR